MNPEITSGLRAEICLPRPFDHGFDYLVPQGMTLRAGDYVSVPFGRQTMLGVVWGLGTSDLPVEKCKLISAHYTHLPPMQQSFREFVDWSSHYTLMEKGLFLKMAMPLPKAIIDYPTARHYQILNEDAGRMTAARRAAIEALQRGEQPQASAAILKAMIEAGQLQLSEQMVREQPLSFRSDHAMSLRPDQRFAADAINKLKGFSVMVLDGVTGSGKTEVYFDVISHIVKKPTGQALVLLPEIALTHQWIDRFEKRFGCAPTLWHSGISVAQRKKNWRAIVHGDARVIVGARSALYLPYPALELIVVDEEHEASYKQEDGVLYHARDMAVVRASKQQIPIILASATPSLETVANSESGKYRCLTLEQRHGAFAYPDVTLIDLRQDKPERGAFIAPTLRAQIMHTMAQGHQAMLFLNRRGYAPLLLCRHCGYRFTCPNCSSWMVSHQHPPRLECHHCAARKLLPRHCPECEHDDELVACGPGVERIVEELQSFMPEAKILSLTSDDDDLPQRIEQAVTHQAQILVGTQLLAKGHHFPHLAVVGVIDADLGLGGGDLRASERTYQLLHQLAGRAGREKAAGRVYLQTIQPEHPVMQAMVAGDRHAFNALELSYREKGHWPPFARLAALILDGTKEAQVKQMAQSLAKGLAMNHEWRVLGPVPAPLSKLRNQYRYRILIKVDKHYPLQHVLKEWRGQLKLPSTLRLRVDIDPYNFL